MICPEILQHDYGNQSYANNSFCGACAMVAASNCVGSNATVDDAMDETKLFRPGRSVWVIFMPPLQPIIQYPKFPLMNQRDNGWSRFRRGNIIEAYIHFDQYLIGRFCQYPGSLEEWLIGVSYPARSTVDI